MDRIKAAIEERAVRGAVGKLPARNVRRGDDGVFGMRGNHCRCCILCRTCIFNVLDEQEV